MDGGQYIEQTLEGLLQIFRQEAGSLEFIYCSVNESVDWEVKPQRLPYFELSLYKGGNIDVRTADSSYALQGSRFTLFDIYKGFQVHSVSGAYHYITFRLQDAGPGDRLSGRMKAASGILESGLKIENVSAIERLFTEIHSEFLLKRPFYRQRISLLLQDMMVQLLRRQQSSAGSGSVNPRHKAVAEQVMSYLGSHYAEAVRLQDIAARTRLTERYADTIFKRATGSTIVQFLTALRVESSKKALLSSGRTITEIALDSGFESSSYFCKVFKKATGLSPSEYRQNATRTL